MEPAHVPEGTRSRNGEIGKLRSGAAVLAAQHGIAIVPIHVTGTHAAMPPGRNWPKRKPGRLVSRRHPVEVRFGAPIWPGEGEHRHDVMARVRAFFEGREVPPPTPPRVKEPAVAEPLVPDLAALRPLVAPPEGDEPVIAPLRTNGVPVAVQPSAGQPAARH